MVCAEPRTLGNMPARRSEAPTSPTRALAARWLHVEIAGPQAHDAATLYIFAMIADLLSLRSNCALASSADSMDL